MNWSNYKLFFFWWNNLSPSDSDQDCLEIIQKVEFSGNALVDTLGSSMVHIPIDNEAETNAKQRISPMDKEHHNHFDENLKMMKYS